MPFSSDTSLITSFFFFRLQPTIGGRPRGSGVVVAREDEPEESLGLEGRFDAVFVSEVTGYGEVCEEKCEVIDKVLIL